MPLTIQLGEIADRLRRFLDVRGRLPIALDETLVPVTNLGDLNAPPFRTNPRGFKGWGDHDGGAATEANWVVFQHQLGHPGASLITNARAIIREASSASGCAIWFMVGHSDVAVGGAVQDSAANLEPLGFTAGNVDYLPLEQREVNETFALMAARGCKRVDEQLFSQAQTPAALSFDFEPILLRAGGFIALGCQDQSAVAVPPDFSATVSGLFFNRLPK